MISQNDLETEVAHLESEIISLKKSQPFYNGQFSTVLIDTGNVYDLSFTTTAVPNFYDISLDYTVDTQPNTIFEPYIEMRAQPSNTLLDISALDVWNYPAVSIDDTIRVKVTVRIYVAIGTLVYVKVYGVATTNSGVLHVSGALR